MKTSRSEKQKEGWMYMSVCMFDFMIAPILWSLIQAAFHGSIQTQWQPLTLQGAGLFHIAMGAVLGIAAMGRTQEKLAGANNGGFVPPANVPPTPGFSQPNAFSAGTSFSAPAPQFPAAPSFSAPKPAPAPTGFGSFNSNVNVDPSDPPARNTRND
jgi:hypothetical protein